MSFINVKWKKRDATDYIYLVKRNLNNIDITALRNSYIRKGNLDTGYHYIIRRNGFVEHDRPEDAYAGWLFNDKDRSVAVLIDVSDTGNMTMATKKALAEIVKKYPKAKIKEVEEES